MKFPFKALLAVGLSVSGMLFTSCTTVHTGHPTVAANAIMCDKCKTTWVTKAEAGGRITRYTRQKAMVCPDCISAVENWARTGNLKHHCAHCGGTMTCEVPR